MQPTISLTPRLGARNIAAIVLCFAFLAAGCAPSISQQTRNQITYTGSFTSLQADPEGHAGEIIMLGGRILSTSTSAEGSEIMVLQTRLGFNHRPKPADQSEGRFLAVSDEFLDPALYRKGVWITLAGKVVGSSLRPIDDVQYRFPQIDVMEIRLWPPQGQSSPQFHIGIGLGTTF
jgi:outer membrane lipoprotein